jgi:hypothetical protein
LVLLLLLILWLKLSLLLLLNGPGLLDFRRSLRFWSRCWSLQALCYYVCAQERNSWIRGRACDCCRFLLFATAEEEFAPASFGWNSPVRGHAVVVTVPSVWRDAARLVDWWHVCCCPRRDGRQTILERRRYRDHAHTASPTMVCCGC